MKTKTIELTTRELKIILSALETHTAGMDEDLFLGAKNWEGISHREFFKLRDKFREITGKK